MKLTEKLLGYLHRVFDKDPRATLALRLTCDGQMTWEVADNALTTHVAGGSGQNLSVDLAAYTIASLAAHLAAQPGYSVPYVTDTDNSLSARVLIDAQGDQAASNGDHLYAYTSLLWVYLNAVAESLREAKLQIVEMLKQMDIRTAAGEWLEEWGGYFGVARKSGEQDAQYSGRIVTEPLLPRCNNRALEERIYRATGRVVRVVDLDWQDTDRFLTTNAPPVIYQGQPVFQQVTNSPDWLTGPFVHGEKWALITSLGLMYTDGIVLYGNPANNNPLRCAFAVLLNDAGLSSVDRAIIQGIVEESRAQGTVALYFAPANLLDTNVAGDITNSSDYTAGPASGQYTQIQL